VPYCSLADVINVEPQQQLVQLTDDEDTGAVVTAVLDAAIASADALIDTYLRGHVTIPASPIPPILVTVSAELTVCNLYKRRFGTSMPEAINDRRKWAEDKLAQIVKGTIKISEEQQQKNIAANVVVKTQSKIFSESVMSRFASSRSIV
jgi:phage gp36-like protein